MVFPFFLSIPISETPLPSHLISIPTTLNANSKIVVQCKIYLSLKQTNLPYHVVTSYTFHKHIQEHIPNLYSHQDSLTQYMIEILRETLATPSDIFLVTNSSPLNGDS